MNNIIAGISIFCLFFGIVCIGFHDILPGVLFSAAGVVSFAFLCD